MHAIDTNVWIYSQDCRDVRKQNVAQNLIATTNPLALPWQVGCEFIATSRKLATVGFVQETAWQCLEAMQAMSDLVILPSPVNWSICKKLIAEHNISFWDGMLLAACVDSGVGILFTEDLSHDSIFAGVRIVNPFTTIE